MPDALQNILFTAVVGPHGVDGEGSRFKNPMALMSNQVTRGQRHYGVTMFSRTFAFDLFGANLRANVAALDFPSPGQLRAMLRSGRWDRVGVGGIIANFEKALHTCRIIREELPGVAIDLGGHLINDDGLSRELIERLRESCPGETFRVASPEPQPPALEGWLRGRGWLGPGVTLVQRDGLEYYARLPGVGLKQPDVLYAPLSGSAFGKRAMGLPLRKLSAGLIIPDVGCPLRCNFCTTSQKFGGRFLRFLSSAEDLLAVADAHAARGATEMFVLSENFSLDTKRALRLLALMEEGHKPYQYSVFSSADALARLGVENMVKLGYCFVWIGLEESTGTAYGKLGKVDLMSLVSSMQAHGIEVLGSTILGFEHHGPRELDREIGHALSYGCTYNQFMLYMAMPGTALWRQMKDAGKLKPDFAWADIHGQKTTNWRHPLLSDAQLEGAIDGAFARDWEELGPSIYRMIRTHFDGWRNTARFPHELVQVRRAAMFKRFPVYIAVLEAMHADLLRLGHRVAGGVAALRDALVAAAGFRGSLARFAGGPLARWRLAVERRRWEKTQREHRQEEPGCEVTCYGELPLARSKVLPARRPAPATVAIRRPPALVAAPDLPGSNPVEPDAARGEQRALNVLAG